MRRSLSRLPCILLVLISCVVEASDEPRRPVRPKILQGQVGKLLNRYLQAKNDVSEQESIVDEAALRGSPFAPALRGVVGKQGMLTLRKYRSLFGQNIGSARRITPEGVVEGNKHLKTLRDRLLRLAGFAHRLDEPIDESLGAEGEKKVDFAERLAKIEADLISQWLANQGYGRLTSTEVALVADVNRHRQRQGLEPLGVDFKLSLAARDHSWDMFRKRFFSHRSKVPGKNTYRDRAQRFGVTAGAENIASCSHAAEAMDLWMASSGHRRNILNPSFRPVGVGRAGKKLP